jgi:hypothetical protein
MLLVGVALLAAAPAQAGLVNDVPSCYAAERIPYRSAAPDKLIYVLLDQTVQLDPQLQHSVFSNVERAIDPGTKFTIAEFSAFSQGHYLTVLHTGIVEPPLTSDQRGNVPIARLPSFDTCLQEQEHFARHMADQTVATVLRSSTSTLDHSDILAALSAVSAAFRQEPEREKVLLVVTDGLENSGITSFYAHGGVRRIDPRVEMAKARAAGMMGDFGGGRVYVLGGAMTPPAKAGSQAQRDGYRDPQTLAALKAFWTEYIGASHAELIEFGEPALLEPVAYAAPAVR